jgi:hypothetical protein
MNAQMKQVIRPKIENYVKRAEEIINILKNGSDKRKAMAVNVNDRTNWKDNKRSDDDDDCRRMMQSAFVNTLYSI